MSTFDIGYCKPPRESRFKKGQSGNPAGRPRGSKNKKRPDDHLTPIEQMILLEGHRHHPVPEGGRTVQLPLMQIIVRATAAKAAKGDTRSQKLFIELMQHTEEKQNTLQRKSFEDAILIQQDLQQKLKAHIKAGQPEETFPHLPHPDDIVIDLKTGDFDIAGPVTEEEATAFDYLKTQMLQEFKSIETLEKRLKRTRSAERSKQLRAEIEDKSNLLEKQLNEFADLGNRWPRHWPIQTLEEWRVIRQFRRDGEVEPPSQLMRLRMDKTLKTHAKKKKANK